MHGARVGVTVAAAALVAVLATAADLRAAACTISWDGPAVGLWETPANWTGNTLPGAADHVCISSGNAVTHSSGNDPIKSLFSQGTLVLSNGTLDLTDTDHVANPSSVTTFTHSGGELGGAGLLSVLGTLTWTGGVHTDGGTTRIEPAATLVYNPSSYLELGGSRLLENDGTIDIRNDGDIYVDTGATTPRLHNDGTIKKTAGTANASLIAVPLDNDGTLRAEAGTLELQLAPAGGVHTGSFTGTAAGTLVRFASGATPHVLGAGATLPGRAELASGSLDLAAGATVPIAAAGLFTHSGGELGGAGLLSVLGTMTWTGGVHTDGGTTRVEPAGTLVYSPSSYVELGGTRLLENDGTIDVRNDGDIYEDTGATTPRIHNDGTFKKTAGVGESTVAVDLDNDGTVHVLTGTLGFQSAFTNDGLLVVENTATASSFQAVTNTGTIRGRGTVVATLTNNGTVQPGLSPGRLTVQGQYSSPSGTLAVEINGATPETGYDQLQVSGQVTLGGTLALSRLASFVPGVGSSFAILTAGSVTGAFSNVTGTDAGGGNTFAVEYTATQVIVRVGTGANTAPVAADDSASTPEDTAVDINVLSNDSDPDEDLLSIATFTQGTNGTVAAVAGKLRYTPRANFNGTDSFTYRAKDAELQSNLATVRVTITPVADAPTANADSYTTAEDSALAVSAPGVLGNDTDPDLSALTAIKVTDPVSGGALTLNANGSLTYTPPEDFWGSDSFTYMANDGALNSNVATVTINVTPVPDDPPVLDSSGAPQMSTVPYGSADPPGDTVAAVLATGAGGDPISDVDGDPEGIAVVATDESIGSWQFSLNNGASWSPLGSVSEATARLLAPSAKIRLVPNAGASGSSAFTFRAWDQSVGTNGQVYNTGSGPDSFSSQTETVTVTVAAQQQHTLTVTKNGAGAGTVTSSPPGIDCGVSCSASFTEQTEVTLTATAAVGSVFVVWTGDCAGAGFVCTVRMDAAKTVNAQFEVAPPPTDEPPPPEPFENVVIRPVSGTIKYRLPGTNTFIELKDGENVPVGTEVDATTGTIRLTSARPGGGLDTGDFFGGFFLIAQLNAAVGGATNAYTELRLSGRVNFALCPKTVARKAKGRFASIDATKPPKRRLWGAAKGRFRTRGRYSAATVRGTTWLTEDRCDGTLTRVTEGRVEVFDFVLRKRVQVRAGQSYLAKPKVKQAAKKKVVKKKPKAKARRG